MFGLIALPAASLGANRLTLLSALSLMNQKPVPRNRLLPLLLVVVTSVTCMNSALLFALLTLNSSIDSTEGNISRAGPPPRLLWLAMPSIEKEVMNGRLPATEMAPPRSCCTPGASVATTIGLVELVARKFNASLLMSSPDRELSIVALLVSMIGLRRDHHLLGRAGDRQPAVDADRLPGEQDRLLHGVREAAQRHPHLVGAGIQIGQEERAVGGAHGCPLGLRARVGHGDGGAGHHRTRGVGDGPGDAAERRLRAGDLSRGTAGRTAIQRTRFAVG